MEEQNLTLKQQMDEMREAILEMNPKKKKREKQFRMPMKAKLSKKRVQDNWVTVIRINENRTLNFTRHPIEDQTVMVDNVPILASSDYLMYFKGKPVIIVPGWSVQPLDPVKAFSPSENFKNSLNNGSNSAGYKLLLASMKSGAMGAKKKISGTAMIGILVVVAIIAYVLFGGGA